MEKVSIVIPCYNSDQTIKGVVEEIISVIDNRYDYEIILVNDGSTEKLWRVIKDLVDAHAPIIKGIRFSKNFGQHAALMAGYRASTGDIIIQMDDDGQSDPVGIGLLLEKIHEGYDVVFARYPEAKESLFRRIGSDVNRMMCISLLGMPRDIRPTSYSAMRRYVADEMVRYNRPYPYVAGLMYRATSNVCDVEVNHRDREIGKSNYSFRKLIKLWMNGFTAFSVKPLEISIYAGFLAAAIGFLVAIYVVIRRFLDISILDGWSSLISIILIMGGLNMALLGLVGEYIGRIYICLNEAPQYVIRDIYMHNEEKE